MLVVVLDEKSTGRIHLILISFFALFAIITIASLADQDATVSFATLTSKDPMTLLHKSRKWTLSQGSS